MLRVKKLSRPSLSLRPRVQERASSNIQQKAPLKGAPRPDGIDTLKFEQVNVQEIQKRFDSVEDSLRQIKAARTSDPDAGSKI